MYNQAQYLIRFLVKQKEFFISTTSGSVGSRFRNSTTKLTTRIIIAIIAAGLIINNRLNSNKAHKEKVKKPQIPIFYPVPAKFAADWD